MLVVFGLRGLVCFGLAVGLGIGFRLGFWLRLRPGIRFRWRDEAARLRRGLFRAWLGSGWRGPGCRAWDGGWNRVRLWHWATESISEGSQ